MPLYVFLATWFLLAVWGGGSGFLARFDSAVIMIGGFVVPWTGYAAGMLFSNRFRQFVATRDLKIVTLLEAGRIIGGVGFGVAIWKRLMSPEFVWVTFLTDEVIGFTAFWAAFVLLGRHPRLFTAWHILGFLCLVASGTLGALCSPALHVFGGPLTSQRMTTLPFRLVPTFFGPIVTIAHFIALTQIWKR